MAGSQVTDQDRLAAIERQVAAAATAATAAKKVAAEASLRAEEALAMTKETHDMVKRMHDMLMEPQPGQKKGLLDRMAGATIAFESGKSTGDRIIWMAGVIAAIGTLGAGLYAAMRGER